MFDCNAESNSILFLYDSLECIQVFDFDAGSDDDFLGQTSLEISTVVENGPLKVTFRSKGLKSCFNNTLEGQKHLFANIS